MPSNTGKTLACVAVAGALFIAAVYYGVKPLFVIAAFFDWLPLPRGWMRISDSERESTVRRASIIHGAVTLVAYAVGVAWLAITEVGPMNLGFVFLEVWFMAVVLGAYVTSVARS